MTQITKLWSKFGFWEYSCGCIQYQDGFDLCDEHKNKGYTSLIEDYENSNNYTNTHKPSPMPE